VQVPRMGPLVTLCSGLRYIPEPMVGRIEGIAGMKRLLVPQIAHVESRMCAAKTAAKKRNKNADEHLRLTAGMCSEPWDSRPPS
jgi:hypothetical protein